MKVNALRRIYNENVLVMNKKSVDVKTVAIVLRIS
jgi:hypothetical protein